MQKEHFLILANSFSVLKTSSDEDVTTQALGERYTVPTGPVTRAQAKRFKEELRSLITTLQDQEIDAAKKEAIKGAQQ